MRKKNFLILISVGITVVLITFLANDSIKHRIDDMSDNVKMQIKDQPNDSKIKLSNISISQKDDQSISKKIIRSPIIETDEAYRDKVLPGVIYLNNTIDTIRWINLSNNTYTVVISDPSGLVERFHDDMFVSGPLHKGEWTQIRMTTPGTYEVSFYEDMTSRGWVNLLVQEIKVQVS